MTEGWGGFTVEADAEGMASIDACCVPDPLISSISGILLIDGEIGFSVKTDGGVVSLKDISVKIGGDAG